MKSARFSTPAAEAPAAAPRTVATLAGVPQCVIDGGEIIMLTVKPSMWRPVFDSAPMLAVTAGLAVLLAAANTPLAGLSLATTLQLVLLAGLARLGVAVVRWIPTWYVLTNRRVITVQGVRAPRGASLGLIAIRNTHLGASISEKLTKLGTITFITDDAASSLLSWRSVASPDDIHKKIRRAIENAIDQQSAEI